MFLKERFDKFTTFSKPRVCHRSVMTTVYMEEELVGSRNTQSAQIATNQDEPNNIYVLS